MKKIKRLFLFAGYDKDNIVDDTVIYYLNALSKNWRHSIFRRY